MHDQKHLKYTVRIIPAILGGTTHDERSILAWTNDIETAKDYAVSFVRHPDATRVYVQDEDTGKEVHSVSKPDGN